MSDDTTKKIKFPNTCSRESRKNLCRWLNKQLVNEKKKKKAHVAGLTSNELFLFPPAKIR